MLHLKRPGGIVALALVMLTAAACQKQAAPEAENGEAPSKYAVTPPPGPAMPADFPQWAYPGPLLKSIPGSQAVYSDVQMYDRASAVDWYPATHAPMPDVVKGRLPVYACAFCHLPQGAGRSENAALAGLSAKYIMEQLADFKSGARKVPDRKFGAGVNMELTAAQIGHDDAEQAANYFSTLRYTKHLQVVESPDVPRFTSNAFVYIIDKKGPREPLGMRIVEGPDDFELFEMRDPNMTFTAYVPMGAIARGAALAKGNGSDKPPCESCHGVGLKGTEIAPPVAGRLPTGLFRQLYGFQTGTRSGPSAALMKPNVTNMSQREMVDLAAYVASLEP